MKKVWYKNIKIYIFIIVAIVAVSGITYSATAYLYESSDIGYDNSSSNLVSTNVQGALDELYEMYDSSGNCPTGDDIVCFKKKSFFNFLGQNANNDYEIKFDQVSSDTNGKGLYFRVGTEFSDYPIYYYRGDVSDNNLIFANFCWKIVRTTETGGIKIVYNGVPSNGQCNNTGSNSLLSSFSEFNTNSNSPSDVGYMYGTRYGHAYTYGTNLYYAPDVTYSNGTYTLTAKGSYNVEKKSTISGTSLNYQHYTCGSSSETTCSNVKYVFKSDGTYAYYLTLSNGKKVEDVLDETLTNSSNTTDSIIKTAIDTWYSNNLTSYTDKLEDTIWCNDRRISDLGAFNPDGGSMGSDLLFEGYNRAMTTYQPQLTCPRKIDSFTVNESSTGNGKLTYPIGMLTSDELMLVGGKYDVASSHYLNKSNHFWLMTPLNFGYPNANVFLTNYYSGSNLFYGYARSSYGIRPAVSLKHSVSITSGDGTATNPYIVGN